MATTPGLLTDWPWRRLGSFKYIILAPWAIQSIYSLATRGKSERDSTNLLILPFLLSRALHNQFWTSISRHRTAKGNNRIVDRSIEFEQVDRESNWDDQILLSGILIYFLNTTLSGASFLPIWRSDGVIMTVLLHAGPVEYVYYWLHRALHHHYLYSRYHSHHHSSIVTEPITSVTHPFAEHISYFVLFLIPLMVTLFTGTASVASFFGYITYIDLMNNMGHCNFEIIPKSAFSISPPLKYLIYTPSFHSLHHTQFRTNYSLFMPFYDYIHGTMDKSTDALHETSVKRQEDVPDVVHLTHLTTPDSLFHLQVGFASFAATPLNYYSTWYMWLMKPITWCCVILNCLCGRTFIVERNSFDKIKLQSWAIPRYTMHYSRKQQAINGFIKEAILQAEAQGVKVLSLGLMNQDDEHTRIGGLIIERYPELKTKIVDGSSLAIAVVINSIPKGTSEVVFRGSLSKMAFAIVSALWQQGIKVATFYESEKLKLSATTQANVFVTKTYTHKIWIVGDGLSEDEQFKAPKGTLFIPFSQFSPKRVRDDVSYYLTPSMVAPPSLRNLNSCENWLPRRVMSAWRVAGILHALEGWNVHECGDAIFQVKKIWEAALRHGFRPATISK